MYLFHFFNGVTFEPREIPVFYNLIVALVMCAVWYYFIIYKNIKT